MCATLEEAWKQLVEKRLDEICRESASDAALSSVQEEGLRIHFRAACNEYLDAFLNYLRHTNDVKHAVEIEIDKRWPRKKDDHTLAGHK
jgi:hypothetical protein